MNQYNKNIIIFSIATGLTCLSATVCAKSVDEQDPRDVEIGAGGDIRLEKPYRTNIEEDFEWHPHLLWESRYVTEGRDNLSGKGIYSVSTEFNYKNINIVPWIADAINTDYSEINLNIVYGIKLLDDLEVFVGYNRIQSREAGVNSNDNEISLDMVYFYDKRFHLSANIYYSFDTEGAFAEAAINKSYRIDDALSVNLRAILGFNSGYVINGHNGINHSQLLARASYQVAKEMEVYAYTGYNLAINRNSNRYMDDDLLRDFFWGGVGMSYRF